MSRRKRLFLGIVALFALGVALLLYSVASDIDSRYRESTEETLVDVAYLLATELETGMRDGAIDVARLDTVFRSTYAKRFEARIFEVRKRRVDLELIVTDARGIVVFDSTGKATGQDFSQWNDIKRVLGGKYGARTSPSNPADPASDVMYVAAPVMHEGRLAGVVSVGKPEASQQAFVVGAQQKLAVVGLIAVAAFLFLLVLLLVWLTRPFGLTADLLRILRQDGLRRPATAWHRMGGVMRANFNDMRDVLAGRSYTEEYIQTLTHELKSPLSAIRGAAELLREPLPDADRSRFAANIGEQVQRLQDLAERLLELTNLEKLRTLDRVQALDPGGLAREAAEAMQAAAQVKGISLNVAAEDGLRVEGDRFLLYQALINLLANAIDFAPPSSAIDIAVRADGKTTELSVRDRGAGIPDFALERVFEKFYSLPRPETGRKSTGLGLSFVREIAHLHNGKVALRNHPEGGALAALRLPAASIR